MNTLRSLVRKTIVVLLIAAAFGVGFLLGTPTSSNIVPLAGVLFALSVFGAALSLFLARAYRNRVPVTHRD